MSANKCTTPGCDNEIHCPTFSLCRNCYGGILRWSKRSTKDQVTRFNKLQLYQARLDTVLTSNVTVKRYKKIERPAVLPGQYMKRKLKKVK
jgi:hypothetical protein